MRVLHARGSSCGPRRLIEHERTATVDLDRGLAAHLCRCTGWRTVYDAIELAASGDVPVAIGA